MRIVLSIALAVAFMVSVPSLFGQTREVSDAEIKALTSAAYQKRNGVPHRVKLTTSGYDDGESVEIVYEYGPNAMRYAAVRRKDGVESKSEWIRIGDVRYVRNPDGSWEKNPPGSGQGSGSGSGAGVGSSSPPVVTNEYVFVGSEDLNGTKADLYRKTQTTKTSGSTPTLLRRIVEQYWFNPEGLLLKETREDLLAISNKTFKSERVYDYDKNLKIVAPIRD